jgi:ligand-binding SRPBCC domain-containing protein
MPRFIMRSTMRAPAEELAAWHLRPGAVERATSP